MFDNTKKSERAIAVAYIKKGSPRETTMEHLAELSSLAMTAGVEIIDTFYQELEKVNPRTAIGKGKVEELRLFIEENEIQLVLFDDDLTPAQVKNLEIELKVKVLDRSALILDIFACHARTVEAKTQVELAQSQYMLPRLTRMWTHLSKQYGGGVGTRGPGETQIETDRRLLKIRIQNLKEKLDEIAVQKEIQRKGRAELPRFALVGYTNAGKSTLMNALTDAEVYVEDKLFATLDTTVRAFQLPNGKKALLSDTVGFIRKLPAHLIASFRSTLAEAREADVLIHVIDASYKQYKEHIQIVNETLENLEIANKPTLMVFNKIDLIADGNDLAELKSIYPNGILVSAGRGINIAALLELLQKTYEARCRRYRLIIPYLESRMISQLYSSFEVQSRTDNDLGTILEVDVKPDKSDLFLKNFKKFFVED